MCDSMCNSIAVIRPKQLAVSKSTVTFFCLLMIQAGDIQVNPGPETGDIQVNPVTETPVETPKYPWGII